MAYFLCPETDGTIYNAFAYYRLSKEDGKKNAESDSIGNQRKLIHEYVSKHPNIVLIGEAYDDGYTGTNYDRPGFQRVMEAIKSGSVNCVIVKDLSRLGREYIETGKYLSMVFPSFGVRFIAINDDVDSGNSKSGDDLIVPIKNIMNESYCRELSKKLRQQFRIQRENGEYVGSFVSYGYLKDPNNKHKLIIDECAANVVRLIFSMKLQGYNQQAIVDHLTANGIPSPLAYKESLGMNYKSGFKTSGDGKWSVGTVRRILLNPLYIGVLIQGKRGTPNYKIKTRRNRNPTDWVIVENNHPPIIPRAVFDTVQKMMERDTRTSPQRTTLLPLSGVLFCPDCGRGLCLRSVSRGSKKFYYYVCPTHKQGKGCSSHSFEQTRLEATVLNAIKLQAQLVVELEELLRQIDPNEIAAAKLNQNDIHMQEKARELARCQDFKMKLYEAFQESLIDREEYDMMKQKYDRQIRDITATLDRLKQQRASLQNEAADGREWLDVFLDCCSKEKLTRDMVVSLIDRIYVHEDKSLEIDFNYKNEIAYYQSLVRQFEKEAS